jgi:hypothetical protein
MWRSYRREIDADHFPCLGGAVTDKDDDAQPRQESEKLDQRLVCLLDVQAVRRADPLRRPDVPGDDVPDDDLAASIDAGLAEDVPHVLGRPVVVVGADEPRSQFGGCAAAGASSSSRIGASIPPSVGSNHGIDVCSPRQARSRRT